ncbi:hypothetical protein SOPP22_06660 [Shewanella sp. OPT22]|nr:hypothetical protein SOPP22_06660 [Shewanella sp. OPT22]
MSSFVIINATSIPPLDTEQSDIEEYSSESDDEHFVVVPSQLTYQIVQIPQTSELQSQYTNFVQCLPDADQFQEHDSLWKKHQLQRNYPFKLNHLMKVATESVQHCNLKDLPKGNEISPESPRLFDYAWALQKQLSSNDVSVTYSDIKQVVALQQWCRYTTYKFSERQCRISDKNETGDFKDKGVVKLSYISTLTGKHSHYLYDSTGIIAPIKVPTKKVKPLKGSSKQLTRAGQSSVSLRYSRLDDKINPSRMLEIQRQLSMIPGLCSTLPFNNTTEISTFGGHNIKKVWLEKNQFLPLQSLWQVCNAVKLAHDKKWFIGDIKPDNMGFRHTLRTSKNPLQRQHPQAAIFDLADACHIDEFMRYGVSGTPGFLTTALYRGKRRADPDIAPNADNYALFLSLMTCTSKTLFQLHQHMVERFKKDNDSIEFGASIPDKGFAAYPEYQHHINAWIDQVVCFKYRSDIREFMCNPDCKDCPAEIIDMIDWSAVLSEADIAVPHN